MNQPADEVFELTLTDIANGGYAVGHRDDKAIFVPYAIPGEIISARILDDHGRYAFAEGITAVELSADRVQPHCPHFGPGKCGGCQWQHIDYPAQLALKTDIVIDQLERVGGFDDMPVNHCLSAPQAWEYRQGTTLYPLSDGGFGYKATDGDTILPIETCHIITPALLEFSQQLDFDLKTLTRVTIVDDGSGDLMVILSTDDDQAPGLEVDFKASVNFLLSDNVPVNLIGATHLNYQLLGRRYRVTAGCFFRHNPAQTETLMTTVLDWLDLRGTESVVNIYSGSGILAGSMAPGAGLITCIDNYAPAMTDAEENLAEFDHIDLIEGNIADILGELTDAYDIAVIDPPGIGMSKDLVEAFEKISPPTLIYIAQDPATLARDVRRLVERYHYRLERVQPIDFEPQTYHSVSVAYLTKEP